MQAFSSQHPIETTNKTKKVLFEFGSPQPCQICKHCDPSTFNRYGEHLADMTWCSECHQTLLCVDAPLIDYYRQHNLQDYVISKMLPKVRWGVGHPRSYLSIDEIHALNSSLFFSSIYKL